MKKKSVPDMLPEYDFSGGIRGKYAKKFAEGTNIVVLASDVHKNFPNSNSVNETLRALSKMVKSNRKKITA
jgi:urate oxidase